MVRKSIAFIAAAVLLFLSLPADAGQANPQHVAATAKWCIHLDFEAVRQTQMFDLLKAELEKQLDVAEGAAALKEAAGFNPLTDIQGATLYSTTLDEGVGGAVIYAKVNRRKVAELISQAPKYKQEDYREHVIHSWEDENKGTTPAGAFYGEDIILLGDKVDTVKIMLDVLDGKREGGSALVKQQPAGTVISGGAAGVAELANRPDGQLFAHAKGLELTVLEKEGKLIASLAAEMDTPQSATQLRTLIEGLKAWVMLDKQQPAQVGQLAGLVQSKVDGSKVVLTFEQPAKEMLEMLKALEQTKNGAPKGGVK